MTGKYFESAELSDVGRKRKNNEDACICIPDHGIFCIADGMGGQAGGDIASEAITTALQQAFTNAAPEDDSTFGRRIALFRKATNQASKWIKNFADEKVIGQMGSTVVALVIDPRNPARAVGLHAGDSRLYRYRKGQFNQITADHSAVAALAAKLGVPPESIPAKYQNELLRAVGLTEAVELEKTPVDIISGDVYLICSDGLTKMQTDEQIAGLLKAGIQDAAAKIAQTLINVANEAGGKDNVSVVIVKVGDLTGAPDIIDLADENADKTSSEAPDLTLDAALNNPPTPSSNPPDSADVHGDTPPTPPSKEITPSLTPNPPSPTPFKPAEALNLAVSAPQSKSAPAVFPPPGSNVNRNAKPSQTEKKFPLGLAVGIAVVVIGLIVWFIATRPKEAAPDVFANPAPKAPPAPDVLSLVKTSAPPAAISQPVTPQTSIPGNANEEAGRTAVKNGQAALDHRDFKNAIALATEALQKIPGDAAAQKLLADAQTQGKNQDAWGKALNNAQAAFNNHDYKNAAGWAAEALRNIPGEQRATQLRASALQQMQATAASSDQDQKYQAALSAAQDDFKKGSFSGSEKMARAALALRPNDPAAQQIIKGIDTQMDLESGRRFFDQGDYDTAAQICQSHPGVDGFTQLAASCRDEQNALAADRNFLNAGDYSFAARLAGQPYARKELFAALLRQAAAEQKLLADLQPLKQGGNWQALTAKLNTAPYAGVTNKASFLGLGQWAKSQADQVENQKMLQQATVTFEKMLVWFNLKQSNDSYIKTAEARKQKRLDGMLEEPQRQQYLATVAWLEGEFGKAGVLNQNDRAKYLKELQDTIAHHE